MNYRAMINTSGYEQTSIWLPNPLNLNSLKTSAFEYSVGTLECQLLINSRSHKLSYRYAKVTLRAGRPPTNRRHDKNVPKTQDAPNKFHSRQRCNAQAILNTLPFLTSVVRNGDESRATVSVGVFQQAFHPDKIQLELRTSCV